MKKWMSMLVLSVSMSMLAVGCQTGDAGTTNQVAQEKEQPTNEVNDVAKEQVAEEKLPEANEEVSSKTPIAAVSETTLLEGLNLGSSYILETTDGNIEIELYASAGVDENGEFILDDGQEWALVARKGEAIYPLMERIYIQNGGLNYTVYTDYNQDGMPHILVEMHSGAGISYYDCTYEKEGFMRETILDAGNINVLYKF